MNKGASGGRSKPNTCKNASSLEHMKAPHATAARRLFVKRATRGRLPKNNATDYETQARKLSLRVREPRATGHHHRAAFPMTKRHTPCAPGSYVDHTSKTPENDPSKNMDFSQKPHCTFSDPPAISAAQSAPIAQLVEQLICNQ